MPDQQTISADEAERILRLEEGHYLDVKRIEIKPGKLSESISAFANTRLAVRFSSGSLKIAQEGQE